MTAPGGRNWGIWDRAAKRWRHEPCLTYGEALRAMQQENEQGGFHLLDIKRSKLKMLEQQLEAAPESAAKPIDDLSLVALRAYVAEIDPQRCCSIERGPARDKFGVFAVLRMDGALTLRSWDREAGRWY